MLSHYNDYCSYERKIKQGWKTIPLITKRTIQVINTDPGLGQVANVVGLNRLREPQHFPLDNWISKGNTYINRL